MIIYTPKDFLLEIGTEELPPREIDTLASSLRQIMETKLHSLGLNYESAKVFSTPRRLAVLITKLILQQPDQIVERKGPPLAIAFDTSSKPTLAALKFAEKCQTDLANVETIEERGEKFLYYKNITPGIATYKLLPDIILESITKLHCRKPMYWGNHYGPFARPIRWLVALFGNEIIPLELWGVEASNKTQGHRAYLNNPLVITEALNYEELLEFAGHVTVDPVKRRQKITVAISELLGQTPLDLDEELLVEVVNLVEWPHVALGCFDKRFLAMPREVLMATLKNHHRCFVVPDGNGIKNQFLIVSNTIDLLNNISRGFEKVIAARLTDAEYFYKLDLRQPLSSNLEKLAQITFQEGLGSLYDKAQRLVMLAEFLAATLAMESDLAGRTALLAKCDLATTMVGEFPELQGTMGFHYALRQNEPAAVALAIREHYLPRFAKDQLATSKLGQIIAIADRIDTLVGLFILGKVPTGEKDPFGLRRAALGLIKTILHGEFSLNLITLIAKSCATYGTKCANPKIVEQQLLTFIYERLQNLCLENGEEISVVRAILATSPSDLLDFTKKLAALGNFFRLPSATSLLESHRRIHNILNKNIPTQQQPWTKQLFEDSAEKNLAHCITSLKGEIIDLNHRGCYKELLEKLLLLVDPLDQFFAKVMVMTENEKIRHNRLAMLKDIYILFNTLADFSHLISSSSKS